MHVVCLREGGRKNAAVQIITANAPHLRHSRWSAKATAAHAPGALASARGGTVGANEIEIERVLRNELPVAPITLQQGDPLWFHGRNLACTSTGAAAVLAGEDEEIPLADPEGEDFGRVTVARLKEMLRAAGVSGYSRLRRDELISLYKDVWDSGQHALTVHDLRFQRIVKSWNIGPVGAGGKNDAMAIGSKNEPFIVLRLPGFWREEAVLREVNPAEQAVLAAVAPVGTFVSTAASIEGGDPPTATQRWLGASADGMLRLFGPLFPGVDPPTAALAVGGHSVSVVAQVELASLLGMGHLGSVGALAPASPPENDGRPAAPPPPRQDAVAADPPPPPVTSGLSFFEFGDDVKDLGAALAAARAVSASLQEWRSAAVENGVPGIGTSFEATVRRYASAGRGWARPRRAR